MIERAISDGTAKPMPTLPPERLMMAEMKDWSEDKILAWFSQRSEGSAQALVAKAQAQAAAQGKSEQVLQATLDRVLGVLIAFYLLGNPTLSLVTLGLFIGMQLISEGVAIGWMAWRAGIS